MRKLRLRDMKTRQSLHWAPRPAYRCYPVLPLPDLRREDGGEQVAWAERKVFRPFLCNPGWSHLPYNI